MQNYMTPISNPLSPKLEAMIKNLTTPQLLDLYKRQATNPNPDLKLTMILGELKNREDLDQKMQQAPSSTVAQDVVQKAAPQPAMPPQGIQQLQPQQPQTQPGIANLPVPDTMFQEQSMAGGGIVSFDEGGHVPRYAGVTDGSLVTQPGTPFSRLYQQLGSSYADAEEARRLREAVMAKYGNRAGVFGMFMNQSDAERKQAKDIVSRLPSMSIPELRALVNVGPTASTEVQKKQADYLTQRNADIAEQVPFNAVTTPKEEKAPAAAPGAGTGKTPVLPEAPEFKPDLLETEGVRKALLQAQERYSPEAIAARREEERKAAGIKDIYAQQMADLQAEKEKMSGDKSKAGWMAALEAGLAIAGGSSPFALQNLGVGALKGVSSYKDALKEINQNEKELRREGNSLARAQQDSIEARLRGDQEAVERGQDRIIQAQSRYEDKADKNAMLTNSAMQFNIGKQFDRNLAVYSAETADNRLSRQLAAEATKFNAQMRMYESRIAASDRATAAKLQANRTAALANMYKDPDYQNFLAQLDERYKSKQGSANPSYQFEKQHYINQYLSNALGLTMEGGSARSAESLLED